MFVGLIVASIGVVMNVYLKETGCRCLESIVSNQVNEQALEMLHEEIIEMDKKGLLENEIFTVSDIYGLDETADRGEILQFMAENLFYSGNIYI